MRRLIWATVVVTICLALFGIIVWLGPPEDSSKDIYRSVMDARYVLGRWPADWQEASEASRKFRMRPGPMDMGSFTSVIISPRDQPTCDVRLKGRDLIGIQCESRNELHWTAATEASIRASDPRESPASNPH